MPENHAVIFRQGYFDQPAVTRPADTLASVWLVDRTVARAQQPLPAVVENSIRLPVQLHRYVGAAIEVGVQLPPEADGKGTAGLACVHHVERNGLPCVLQVAAVAQSQALSHMRRMELTSK